MERKGIYFHPNNTLWCKMFSGGIKKYTFYHLKKEVKKI